MSSDMYKWNRVPNRRLEERLQIVALTWDIL
jgi:hypothetical protein